MATTRSLDLLDLLDLLEDDGAVAGELADPARSEAHAQCPLLVRPLLERLDLRGRTPKHAQDCSRLLGPHVSTPRDATRTTHVWSSPDRGELLELLSSGW